MAFTEQDINEMQLMLKENTLRVVAQKYNISRERVRQLADPKGEISREKLHQSQPSLTQDELDFLYGEFPKVKKVLDDWNKLELSIDEIKNKNQFTTKIHLSTFVTTWRKRGVPFKSRGTHVSAPSDLDFILEYRKKCESNLKKESYLEEMYHDYFENQIPTEELEKKYDQDITSIRQKMHILKLKKKDFKLKRQRVLSPSEIEFNDKLFDDYFINKLSEKELFEKYNLKMQTIRTKMNSYKKIKGTPDIKRAGSYSQLDEKMYMEYFHDKINIKDLSDRYQMNKSSIRNRMSQLKNKKGEDVKRSQYQNTQEIFEDYYINNLSTEELESKYKIKIGAIRGIVYKYKKEQNSPHLSNLKRAR